MTIITFDKPTKVSEIKKKFSDQFPYLRIEFFKKKHKVAQGSLKKDIITDDFIISSSDKESAIMFGENTLVSELEKQFDEKFKLSAQIFRKSGKTWLETTYTDSWSLKKQNEEGLELSNM